MAKFYQFVLLIIICHSIPGQALWSFRPEAGLGFTNNANYETSGTDSDTYWWSEASGYYYGDASTWNLWLAYQDFSQQSHNDVMSWRVGSMFSADSLIAPGWELGVGIGGQNFTETSPGTTEDGFDYFYMESYLLRSFALNPRVSLDVEPGYRFKNFSQFGSRKDHVLYTATYFYVPIKSVHRLGPYIELGSALSNDSLYSKNYFELGGFWDWRLRANTMVKLTFLKRFLTYPNRRVSQETVISRRRGKIQTTSQEEKETQNFTQLRGSFIKIWKDIKLEASVLVNSLSSKSGYEDYSELGLMGSLSKEF